jgi:6-phosphogluconolactonase
VVDGFKAGVLYNEPLHKWAEMRFYSEMKILRHFVFTLLVVVFLLTSLSIAAAPAADHGKYIFFVGTYTMDDGKKTKSEGIYAYSYDAATAQITPVGLAAETTNPSFVAISPNGKFLYAVNEVQNYQGPNSGGVSAFAIDRDNGGHATGKLTFLNEVPSRGADPCYIIVDKSGKHVLVANYTGGSVAVFPILADGKLGEATAFVQHTGKGANPQRQEGPHAHSIDLSPDNRFAFVDDLGLDEVKVYKFDSAKGSLTPNDPPFAKVEAGSGPRHFALHPNGKFAYVVSEMAGIVTVFAADLKAGTLHSVQTISTLPKGFTGLIEDAEIEVHPSGKFLYASNRGDANSIAVYAIDPEKGILSLVDITPTQGKTPRHFQIDPTGTLLFAENSQSNNTVVFHIDPKTGKLTPTGRVLDVGSPVCVKFLKTE